MTGIQPTFILSLGIIIIVSTILFMYTNRVKKGIESKLDAMFQLIEALTFEVTNIKTVCYPNNINNNTNENNINKNNTNENIEIQPSIKNIDIDNSNKITVSDDEYDSDESDDDDDNSNISSDNDEDSVPNIDNTLKEIVDINDNDNDISILNIKSINLGNDNIDTEDDNNITELNTVDLDDINATTIVNLDIDNLENKHSETELNKLAVKDLKDIVIEKGGTIGKMNKKQLIQYIITN